MRVQHEAGYLSSGRWAEAGMSSRQRARPEAGLACYRFSADGAGIPRPQKDSAEAAVRPRTSAWNGTLLRLIGHAWTCTVVASLIHEAGRPAYEMPSNQLVAG
jgi:hypothetical protein